MSLPIPTIAAALSIAALVATPLAVRADTSINGLVYADFTDKQNQDKATGAKSSDSGVGTDVKRFYFTVTHEFDSIWSAQFQTDIGDQGARRYDVFVKKAYIKAKLDPLFQVLLGSANQPWIPYVDDITGFRYVEQSITDRLGFGNSADSVPFPLAPLAAPRRRRQPRRSRQLPVDHRQRAARCHLIDRSRSGPARDACCVAP